MGTRSRAMTWTSPRLTASCNPSASSGTIRSWMRRYTIVIEVSVAGRQAIWWLWAQTVASIGPELGRSGLGSLTGSRWFTHEMTSEDSAGGVGGSSAGAPEGIYTIARVATRTSDGDSRVLWRKAGAQEK